MSAPSRGMGRGLAEILRVAGTPAVAADDLRSIPVELIVPNPKQPRRSFAAASLEALAGSLRERGVLQPVLVRPVAGGTYELVAGERRWRAAQIAGLENVPALVRDRDDAEALEAALIENMAREDLNPVEEARACAALVEELGLTRESVGLRLIWISWPQLTAIQAAGFSVCGLPSNVIGQPGTGGRGAGKRTCTPLLARCPAMGESSRNCSFIEKSP